MATQSCSDMLSLPTQTARTGMKPEQAPSFVLINRELDRQLDLQWQLEG